MRDFKFSIFLSFFNAPALADKKDDRGVYRKIPVRIMGARHEPVQPYLIQPKMEQLLADYANSEAHIVTKLARFHIEFEGIHPFIDGKFLNNI